MVSLEVEPIYFKRPLGWNKALKVYCSSLLGALYTPSKCAEVGGNTFRKVQAKLYSKTG